MLDRLIDVIVEFIERLYLFQIIKPYEKGVFLRCGQFKKVVEPGIYFTFPLFDMIFTDNVVPRTVNLGAQSLTTKDGVPVVVGGVVTASISSIRTALLEVEGVDDALKDSCYGVIGQLVNSHTWDELHTDDFAGKLTDACKKQASDYGIRIKRVQLSDLARMRAIRLHVDQTNSFKDAD